MYEQHYEISPEYQLHALADVQLGAATEIIDLVANLVSRSDGTNPTTIRDALNERETLGSTEIMPGVYLPHATLDGPGRSHVTFVLPTNQQIGRLIIVLLVRNDAAAATQTWVRKTMQALADDKKLQNLYSQTQPQEFADAVFRLVTDQ